MTVSNRPWYISDRLCDRYAAIARNGGDVKRMQVLKIVESILANIGVIVVGIFAILEGGDPTILGSGTLTVLGILNGVSLSEYLAARQAIEESKQEVVNDE